MSKEGVSNYSFKERAEQLINSSNNNRKNSLSPDGDIRQGTTGQIDIRAVKRGLWETYGDLPSTGVSMSHIRETVPVPGSNTIYEDLSQKPPLVQEATPIIDRSQGRHKKGEKKGEKRRK